MANATCSFAECVNDSRGPHGLCDGHRTQARKGQDLRPLGTYERRSSVCTVDDCTRRHVARGFCNLHLKRLDRTGSTDDPRLSLEQRFWLKVDRRGEGECWPWLGTVCRYGYGRLKRGDGSRAYAAAHRVAYEAIQGPLPDGAVVDHLCHNADLTCPGRAGCPHRLCCNPAHLDATTIGENVSRAAVNYRRRL